jgi:hypothetical protein
LNEAWRFFSPFTQTSEGAGPPEQQVTLVIELEQGSKIEFLNFLQVKPDSLASYELFIHETEKKFKEAMNALLLSMAIDSGYCGIDQFLEESCDEAKAKGKPGECLIGADFVSPC